MFRILTSEGPEDLDTAELVGRMLDGRIEQGTVAQNLAVSEAEAEVVRLLGHRGFDELCDHLLKRLHALYATGPGSESPERLLKRVQALLRWDWPEPLGHTVRLRLIWAEAWLQEMVGATLRAIRGYTEFLRLGGGDPVLRLLAYNNRGVLRITVGRVEGVRDLARAAIMLNPEQRRQDRFILTNLPAACFSLLNLINAAWRCDRMRRQVDRVLVDFMGRVPRPVRERWLGPDPSSRNGEARHSSEVAESRDEDAKTARTGQDSDRVVRPICDDPRTLNRFVSLLARQAGDIAKPSDPQFIEKGIEGQLRLWGTRPDADVVGGVLFSGPEASGGRHGEYAEAASLLYARLVPSYLVPREAASLGAVRLARANLERAEAYLDEREFDLALLAAESARETLRDRPEGGRRARTVQRRAERVVATVKRRRKAYERLRLREEYGRLEGEVATFRGSGDLCRARMEADRLLAWGADLKGCLSDLAGRPSAQLVEDLMASVTQHLQALEEENLKARVSGPREALRAAWPLTWTVPVPDEAYAALQQCLIADPQGRTEAWDALENELDQHQARHLYARSVEAVSGSGPADPEEVRCLLQTALMLDVSLGPATAPIFGLLSLPLKAQEPDSLLRIREGLLEAANQFLGEQVLSADEAGVPGARANLIERACKAVERLVPVFPGIGAELVDLWANLERGFRPALASGRPEEIEVVERLVRVCMDACPMVAAGEAAPADPRNPLRQLLEECQVSRALAQGELSLNAPEPDLMASSEFFTEALGFGLGRTDHLTRAVTGLALAGPLAGLSSRLQRQVLDRLEAWVATVAPEEAVELGGAECLDRIRQIVDEAMVEDEGACEQASDVKPGVGPGEAVPDGQCGTEGS